MNRHTIIAAALLVASTVNDSVIAQDDGYRPETGRLHPDFVLPRIDTREQIALSAFRGKKVLLIHFASW